MKTISCVVVSDVTCAVIAEVVQALNMHLLPQYVFPSWMLLPDMSELLLALAHHTGLATHGPGLLEATRFPGLYCAF